MGESDEFQSLDKFFGDIDFVVPGHSLSSQYMVAIHRGFYEWASARVGGGTVLEAGCGEGFGAELLSQSADYVVAIDIKPELIEHARRRYQRPNIDFQVMDCQALRFEDESFDAVVSNELIEHLPRYGDFLREAQRVLRPGGRFLCATTNAAITFKKADGSPMNRNHYQEFNAGEIRRELSSYFQSVALLSQIMNEEFRRFTFHRVARGLERLLVRMGVKHKIPIRLRNRVRQRLTGVDIDDATEAGFQIVEGHLNEALYLIADAVKHRRAEAPAGS